MNVQNAIKEICDQYRGLEGFNSSILLDLLLRVLETRNTVGGSVTDANQLYNAMMSATNGFPIRFFGTKDTFAIIYSILFDIEGREIVEYVSSVREAGSYNSVSPAVLKLFDNRLSENSRTCFIPDFEQYGERLYDLIVSHPNTRFTLSTRMQEYVDLYQYAFSNHDNVEFLRYREHSTEGLYQKFDLILCIPVMGVRVNVWEEDYITNDSEFVTLQDMLLLLGFEGELAIVLPGKITFGTGRIDALRKFIQHNYAIKEMSTLPHGVFGNVGIKTYFFVFGVGSTDSIVVKKYEPPKASGRNKSFYCDEYIEADSTLLFADELEDLDNWNIDLLFSKDDPDIQDFRNSEVRRVTLGDYATIFRGKAVPSSLIADDGNIGIVNIADITDLGIEYDELDKYPDDERKIARYLLQNDDVLISARGTKIKVAVFHVQDFPCIASSNLIVIRPDAKLDGTYLKLFLESTVGTKMLKSLQRGASIMNINYSDVPGLEIPLPPIEKQRQIAVNYIFQLSSYQQSIRLAEVTWKMQKEQIYESLY